MTTGTVTLRQTTTAASSDATASFLRDLADQIEADAGATVLIGLWNTGFGEPNEFTFQVVFDRDDKETA